MDTLSGIFVGVLALVAAGGIVAGLFLAFRHFVLWYWRVGEIVSLLERQARATERTAAALEEFMERMRPGR